MSGRFRTRDESLEDHYENRIKALRKELEEFRIKEESLEAQLKEMKSVDFDELRSAQIEKHKLQKEVRLNLLFHCNKINVYLLKNF